MIRSPFVLLVLSLMTIVYSQSYENVSDLHDTLLQNYKSGIRPLNNQSESMDVNVSFALFSIPDVDQVRGAVSFVIQLQVQWYDERIVWTPSDYNNLTSVVFLSQDVWTPSLGVANPIELLRFGEKWNQVTYQNDGRAFFGPSAKVEASCSFYLRFWPFDKQICSLNIFSYGFASYKSILHVPEVSVITSFYSPNGEWDLDTETISTDRIPVNGGTVIVYKFRLTRQYTFYLLTIILPLNAVGGLTALVFLLPSASGERASYSITIILALAVFLTVISEDLPKTSDPVPIMCVLILFGVIISVVALVVVVFNLILYHRDDKIPISAGYRRIVKLARCKPCQSKRRSNSVASIRQNFNNGDDDNGANPKTISSAYTKTMPTEKTISDKEHLSEDCDVTDDVTWQDVSDAIDKLVIITMPFLAYIPMTTMLIYMAMTSDFPEQS